MHEDKCEELAYERHVKELVEAYSSLIRALYWERDRWLHLAGEIAVKHGDVEAKRMLGKQTEHIRKQAIR